MLRVIYEKTVQKSESFFLFTEINQNEFTNQTYLYKSTVGNTVDKCHNACASKTQNNGGKSFTSSNSEMATKN